MKINRSRHANSAPRLFVRRYSRLLLSCFGVLLLLSLFRIRQVCAELTTNGEVAGLRAQFLDVNGIRTRYYGMGEGEPMVLVHGGGWSGHYSANIWSKDIPRLAMRFHVFAPDKIGSGMTDHPADDNDFNIQGEVDHIYDFIRVMKLGAVHLVGEGRGGACVLFLALEHPEVVRDLIIVNSNTAAPEQSTTSDEAFGQCPKVPENEAWKCRMRSLTASPDVTFDDEYFMAAKYMSLLPKSQETAVKIKGGAGGELGTEAGFTQWKSEWLERIRKQNVLSMPILIYWSRDDKLAPLASGQALDDMLGLQNPRVQMIAVDEAGHFPFREHPEKFVSDVMSFVRHWETRPDDTQISANPAYQNR